MQLIKENEEKVEVGVKLIDNEEENRTICIEVLFSKRAVICRFRQKFSYQSVT